MVIACFFCGQEGDYEDTAAALAEGWYTHRLTTKYVTMPDDVRAYDLAAAMTPDAVSMGFVCSGCVSPA